MRMMGDALRGVGWGARLERGGEVSSVFRLLLGEGYHQIMWKPGGQGSSIFADRETEWVGERCFRLCGSHTVDIS